MGAQGWVQVQEGAVVAPMTVTPVELCSSQRFTVPPRPLHTCRHVPLRLQRAAGTCGNDHAPPDSSLAHA